MKTQKSSFEQNGGTYMQVGDVLLPNLTINSQGGAEETVSYTDGKGRAVFHPEYNTLTITASKGLEEEDKDKKSKIVHQERYEGSMTRFDAAEVAAEVEYARELEKQMAKEVFASWEKRVILT